MNDKSLTKIRRPDVTHGKVTAMSTSGILCDREIRHLCITHDMISPYVDESVRVNELGEPILSYGPSSYGYDLRLDTTFKVFHNRHDVVVDPKGISPLCYDTVEAQEGYIIVPPNGFVLGSSVERIKMPRNVTATVLGKSSVARCGLNCLATPLEAGWEGFVTLEFSNSTPLPVKLYVNEGCCQVLFYIGADCDVSYADRGGKYQNQSKGPVLPKV